MIWLAIVDESCVVFTLTTRKIWAMFAIDIDGSFGWIHPPKIGEIKNVGVVLCPGLKTDELTGYRQLRLLAESLSKSGYPTLRLHYPGTGNSVDSGNVEYLSTWTQSINKAVDYLRNQFDID